MSLITAVVLTKNELHHLKELIPNLRRAGCEIFIVDSGSTDGTLQFARGAAVNTAVNNWVDYSTQFNWALDNLPIETEWVLRIDADERLAEETVTFFREKLSELPPSVAGIVLTLRIVFLGRLLRWGGVSSLKQLRLFRRVSGRCEVRKMDEHIVVSSGDTIDPSLDLIHYPVSDLDQWIIKHCSYAHREAQDICEEAHQVQMFDFRHPAAWRRFARNVVYLNAPRFVRPACFWVYRYCLRGGFMDGWQGFVYHFLQCLWYRTMVDIRVKLRSSSTAEDIRLV